MSAAKPCPRPADGEPCGRRKMKGKQSCRWHWLARQSSDVQAKAAIDRREAQLGHDNAVYQARVAPAKWPEGERWRAGCQSFVPLFYCSPPATRADVVVGHWTKVRLGVLLSVRSPFLAGDDA